MSLVNIPKRGVNFNFKKKASVDQRKNTPYLTQSDSFKND